VGISYRIVKNITKDIRRRRCYTSEDIKRIRELVRKTNNKAEVARRLGIPYDIVLKNTLDAGDYGKRLCLSQQWKNNQGLHAEKTFSIYTDGTSKREVDSFFARQEGRGDESYAAEIR